MTISTVLYTLELVYRPGKKNQEAKEPETTPTKLSDEEKKMRAQAARKKYNDKKTYAYIPIKLAHHH